MKERFIVKSVYLYITTSNIHNKISVLRKNIFC